MHHVPYGSGLTHHVEPPQARVCVAGVEGLEAVAQVPLAGHLGQFTGQVLEGRGAKREGPTSAFPAATTWYASALECHLQLS